MKKLSKLSFFTLLAALVVSFGAFTFGNFHETKAEDTTWVGSITAKPANVTLGQDSEITIGDEKWIANVGYSSTSNSMWNLSTNGGKTTATIFTNAFFDYKIKTISFDYRTNSGISVTWTVSVSSESSSATVNGSGNQSFDFTSSLPSGTITISSSNPTGGYQLGTITIVYTDEDANDSIELSTTSLVLDPTNSTGESITVTSTGDVIVSDYDNSLITITGLNNGIVSNGGSIQVIPLGICGKTEIKFTVGGANKKCSVEIKLPDTETFQPGYYKVVTNVNNLTNRENIVFASSTNSNSAYVMSATSDNNVSGGLKSINDNYVYLSGDSLLPITLETADYYGNSSNLWRFKVNNDKFLGFPGSGNYLRAVENNAEDYFLDWSISIAESGEATVIPYNGDSASSFKLQFNNTSKIFSSYATTQKPIYIFEKTSDTVVPATSVTMSETSLNLFVNQSKTITAAVNQESSMKSIVWESNNANITVVDGKITAKSTASIGDTATIKAIAYGAGAEGADVVGTCTVTIVEPNLGELSLKDGSLTWSKAGSLIFNAGDYFRTDYWTIKGNFDLNGVTEELNIPLNNANLKFYTVKDTSDDQEIPQLIDITQPVTKEHNGLYIYGVYDDPNSEIDGVTGKSNQIRVYDDESIIISGKYAKNNQINEESKITTFGDENIQITSTKEATFSASSDGFYFGKGSELEIKCLAENKYISKLAFTLNDSSALSLKGNSEIVFSTNKFNIIGATSVNVVYGGESGSAKVQAVRYTLVDKSVVDPANEFESDYASLLETNSKVLYSNYTDFASLYESFSEMSDDTKTYLKVHTYKNWADGSDNDVTFLGMTAINTACELYAALEPLITIVRGEVAFDNLSDTGACRGAEGSYSKAKDALSDLNDEQRLYFVNNISEDETKEFANEIARLEAWAIANGETLTIDTSTGEVDIAESRVSFLSFNAYKDSNKMNQNLVLFVILGVGIASIGLYFGYKKNKAN